MKYFKQLDGLRFFAILGVLIAHWLQSTISIDFLKDLHYGSGVTLFFVISGFLITTILFDFNDKNRASGERNIHSIKSFYARRTLRIFPIYYLTIILLFLLNFQDSRILFPWLISYTTNIKMALVNNYIGSFTHFWSLAVEEQFYLFWAFFMVFIPRKYLKITILISILFSLLLKYYYSFFTPYWMAANALVLCNMYSLGSGALIAWYFRYKPAYFEKIKTKKIKIIVLVLILVYLTVFAVCPKEFSAKFNVFADPYLAIIYALIVFLAVKASFKGFAKKILENRVVVYLGKISYGLYIYHLFIPPLFYLFLNNLFKIHTTDFGYFLIFLVLNISLASLTWFFFEKPILGLKRYFKY